MRGNIKRVFPGGNTSEGFFSYYSYLLEKGTRRTFVLKGGPGVGKSTLMKKIGQKMVESGYDVEFHHCSSDNQSLDGIAILEAGIVMVDGTAPHIVDPKYPGGLDEIINLGDFWDVEEMQLHNDKIIASTQEVSRLFARAYRFLGAARDIAENITAMYQRSMDLGVIIKIATELEKEFFQNNVERIGVSGKDRHLFSCAYTPSGFIDFTESILQDTRKVYYLEGRMGTGKTALMTKVASRALDRGYEVEIYHTPLIPQKISTILIKELGLALTTSDLYKENYYQAINLNDFLDKSILAGFAEDIQKDTQLFEDLISRGLAEIAKAKAEHDLLEKYYVPHMDFAAANEKHEEILSRILTLAESNIKAASAKLYN